MSLGQSPYPSIFLSSGKSSKRSALLVRGSSKHGGIHDLKLHPSGIATCKQFATAVNKFFVGVRYSLHLKLPVGSFGVFPAAEENWLLTAAANVRRASSHCSLEMFTGSSWVAPAKCTLPVRNITLSTSDRKGVWWFNQWTRTYVCMSYYIRANISQTCKDEEWK